MNTTPGETPPTEGSADTCQACDEAAARRQAQFDADRQRMETALAEGGWVTDLADGSHAILPEAPERLTAAYHGLMTYGYANGLVAS